MYQNYKTKAQKMKNEVMNFVAIFFQKYRKIQEFVSKHRNLQELEIKQEIQDHREPCIVDSRHVRFSRAEKFDSIRRKSDFNGPDLSGV